MTKISTKPVENKIQDRIQNLIFNIANDFSLEKLSKSPARFNTKKLDWFNQEYIKMLGLEEFCLRSFRLNNIKKYLDYNLRKGVYIYLVDFKRQKILTNNQTTKYGQDGVHYMLGGGMDEGESEIQTLFREVFEESNGDLKIDQNLVKHICTANIIGQPYNRDQINYHGKQMSFWFYKYDSTQFETLNSRDSFGQYVFKWFDVEQVISTNTYLTYPIWKEFCEVNGLDLFEPNKRIKTQYLAWSLDKNRITTLNEFGLESDCILNYTIPKSDLIKWKKITLGESIANLNELLPFLKSLYSKLELQQNALFANKINDLPVELEKLTKLWENELKLWISENSKDAGSYLWPLRTALSGKVKSPSPFEILAILEWKEVEKRIEGITTMV
jgi:glutamyl/glutaminyl-tRNA synthetase